MSGNWVMGREKRETMPNKTNSMEITVESTGRSMNFLNIKMWLMVVLIAMVKGKGLPQPSQEIFFLERGKRNALIFIDLF